MRRTDLTEWADDGCDVKQLASYIGVDGREPSGVSHIRDLTKESFTTLLRRRSDLQSVVPNLIQLRLGVTQFQDGQISLEVKVPESTPWPDAWVTYQKVVDQIFGMAPEARFVDLYLQRGREVERWEHARWNESLHQFVRQAVTDKPALADFVNMRARFQRYRLIKP
ncbi:MAG TPA: hypothetical protein VGK74_20615 [Symbiobacteriaceae bacterium]|jgi:hypothetical protein